MFRESDMADINTERARRAAEAKDKGAAQMEYRNVLQQQMRRNGGSVVFTYYPNTNQISHTDARHETWRRFIEYVRENEGIDILDPYPRFLTDAPQTSMVWSPTDKHPNCAAHKSMADFLVNDPMIKRKFRTVDSI